MSGHYSQGTSSNPRSGKNLLHISLAAPVPSFAGAALVAPGVEDGRAAAACASLPMAALGGGERNSLRGGGGSSQSPRSCNAPASNDPPRTVVRFCGAAKDAKENDDADRFDHVERGLARARGLRCPRDATEASIGEA